MVRVLHLLEVEAEMSAQRGAHHLSRDLGPGFEAIVLTAGRGGDLPGLARAAWKLRRLVADRRFDLVHAWGGKALALAALALPGSGASAPPLVYAPATGEAGPRAARWLRAVAGHRDLHVVCAGATQHRLLVTRGVPVERCHAIRPGVHFARVRGRRDAALRSALRLAPDDRVLLAVGPSTREAGHELAAWTAGLLHAFDPRYKLLLLGRGPRAGAVRRFEQRLRLDGASDVARYADALLGRRAELEDLLPAADVVLVTARGPVDPLPVCVAMAAALPIVSTVTPEVSELLEDRHTALMVPRPSATLLARRVLQLDADARLTWQLADMARTEAYEFFALTRFLNQWRQVYRQVAARQAVSVPEAAPGAGLRFHGRA